MLKNDMPFNDPVIIGFANEVEKAAIHEERRKDKTILRVSFRKLFL